MRQVSGWLPSGLRVVGSAGDGPLFRIHTSSRDIREESGLRELGASIQLSCAGHTDESTDRCNNGEVTARAVMNGTALDFFNGCSYENMLLNLPGFFSSLKKK